MALRTTMTQEEEEGEELEEWLAPHSVNQSLCLLWSFAGPRRKVNRELPPQAAPDAPSEVPQKV